MQIPPPEPSSAPLPHHVLDYLRSLANTVDSKADYFPGHSDAVAYLVTIVTTELHVRNPLQQQLVAAALLHDTGKIFVPDSILNAERPLTVEERTIMRQHSVWSAEIAKGISGLEVVAPWLYHQHEHWDGSGYPDGLVGEQIPWQSRLLLICDAFHVMTTHRVYREPLPRYEAWMEISEHAGIQFDPALVAAIMDRAVITMVETRTRIDPKSQSPLVRWSG